jgi:DNA-binding XRE family transcriptional regulator
MNQQDTEQLRREIERTRAELGATVEALSHKADVKAQARAKAEQAKVQAREKAELARSQAQQKPAVPLAAGIGVAIVVLWLIRRRRRS